MFISVGNSSGKLTLFHCSMSSNILCRVADNHNSFVVEAEQIANRSCSCLVAFLVHLTISCVVSGVPKPRAHQI